MSKFAEQLDKIKEQEWFQQLKSSYDQLSPDQQNYLRWGSLGAGALVFGYLIIGTIQSANTAKNEYFEKQALVELLHQSTDEMRRLKGQNSNLGQGTPQNWKAIFQGFAGQVGFGPDAVEVSKESPGSSLSAIQETLLEIQVKNVQLRPLVQFLYQIEHGSPPMKLKGLRIDGGAADGLLKANLNISGYLSKPEKGEKTK